MLASTFCTMISLFSRQVDLISLFLALYLTSVFHDVWCYHIQSLLRSISLSSKPLVSFGREASDLSAQGRGLGLGGPISQ